MRTRRTPMVGGITSLALCALLLGCPSSSSPPQADGALADSSPTDSARPEAAPPDMPRDLGPADLPAEDQPAAADLQPDAPGPITVELGPSVSLTPAQAAPGQWVTVRYGGKLASRSNLTLHYGFNGWNSVAGMGLASENDGTGNTDYYAEQAMTPTQLPGGGPGFEASLQLPLQARALHMAFYAVSSGGTKTWDSNDGKDFNHGVRFPYMGPYLEPGPQPNPASTLTVSFVTGDACVGRVAYGTTAALGQLVSETTPGRVHHLRLSALTADTTYSYRVACGARGPSPLYSARTAPGPAGALQLAVLGDMQESGEGQRWPKVAQEITAHHPDARLLLVVGDMAWNDRPGLWWTFFDGGRELLASRLLVPVAGNHDTPGVTSNPDTASYEGLFHHDATSGSETVYQLRYGPLHLLLLNSEWPADFAKGSGAQYQFAQQTLAALASAQPPWVFASWHVPPYNVGTRHMGEQGTFRDLTELFDGSVDWFFGGHEHLYQRTKPLRYNGVLASSGAYGRAAGDGVGYLVVPPAGAWPETQVVAPGDPKGYYRDRLAFPALGPIQTQVPSETGFVIVSLAGKAMTLTTYGMGDAQTPKPAHVVDQLSYTRP